MYLVDGFDCSDLGATEVVSISRKEKPLIPTISWMHDKRRKFGMCSFAGCIFVAGGYINGGCLDNCEVYSTESCEWIKTSNMNTKRRSFALI